MKNLNYIFTAALLLSPSIAMAEHHDKMHEADSKMDTMHDKMENDKMKANKMAEDKMHDAKKEAGKMHDKMENESGKMHDATEDKMGDKIHEGKM
jgi:outer membrane murein-binding lipoprotein Lpp